MALRRFNANTTQGYAAAGDIGSNSTWTPVITNVKGRGILLSITSTLDTPIHLSLDGGTTIWAYLPYGSDVPITWVLDLGSNDAEYSGTISVRRYAAFVPGSGFFCASVGRVF
jgi:hypothetical protein